MFEGKKIGSRCPLNKRLPKLRSLIFAAHFKVSQVSSLFKGINESSELVHCMLKQVSFKDQIRIKKKIDKNAVDRFRIRICVKVFFYMYIYLYMNYIIHCKIERHNHQVPKTVRAPVNKTNLKKIK